MRRALVGVLLVTACTGSHAGGEPAGSGPTAAHTAPATTPARRPSEWVALRLYDFLQQVGLASGNGRPPSLLLPCH